MGKRHKKKKHVDSLDYQHQNTLQNSRFSKEDKKLGFTHFPQGISVYKETSDSDSKNNQSNEGDKSADVNSEVLQLPTLNKKIVPKHRNLRGYQSQNDNNTASEPRVMSMYGEATPMSHNIVQKKADNMIV